LTLRSLPTRWYALEVETGRQYDVKETLEAKVREQGYQHHIIEIAVPEKTNPAAFADCVMVKMVMCSETWRIVSATDGVKEKPRVLEKGKYFRTTKRGVEDSA
jgi:transcription antitermination factor NusG|tara:strand:+ start:385 stop:693 length:309 start_codon:yes stop_codon:yes gene_type:complete